MATSLSKIARWIVGLFFAGVTFISLFSGSIIYILISLIITVICIPPMSEFVESKINLQMSGNVRFGAVFLLFIIMCLVPHPEQTVKTEPNILSGSDTGNYLTPSDEYVGKRLTDFSLTMDNVSRDCFKLSNYLVENISTDPNASQADLGWVMDANKDCLKLNTDLGKISTDMKNIGDDVNNSKFDTNDQNIQLLNLDGQQLIIDSQQANITCYNYTVSTKYEETQLSWYACSCCFKSIGNETVKISNDLKIKNFWDNSDQLDEFSQSEDKIKYFLNTLQGNCQWIQRGQWELHYASIQSHIYHNANCPYVAKIKPDDLQLFNSRQEAEAADYRPCIVCGG